jgi:hypothetical protein
MEWYSHFPKLYQTIVHFFQRMLFLHLKSIDFAMLASVPVVLDPHRRHIENLLEWQKLEVRMDCESAVVLLGKALEHRRPARHSLRLDSNWSGQYTAHTLAQMSNRKLQVWQMCSMVAMKVPKSAFLPLQDRCLENMHMRVTLMVQMCSQQIW